MKLDLAVTSLLSGALLFISFAEAPASAVVITSADIQSSEYSGSLCSLPASPCSSNDLSAPGTVMLGSSYLTFSALPSTTITASITAATPFISTGSGAALPATGVFTGFGPSQWNSTASYAGVQYYAAIVGPTNPAIPIELNYTLVLDVSSGSSDSAYIALNPSAHLAAGTTVPLRQLSTGAASTNGETTHQAYNDAMPVSGTLTDNVAANTQFDIGELIRINGGSTGFAEVDPVLFIDPSFAAIDPNYLTDYTIVFAPGVGNTEPVPEPLTLSIFGVGLAGTVALRRRKVKA